MTNPVSGYGLLRKLNVPDLPVNWQIKLIPNEYLNAEEIERVEDFVRNREDDGKKRRPRASLKSLDE